MFLGKPEPFGRVYTCEALSLPTTVECRPSPAERRSLRTILGNGTRFRIDEPGIVRKGTNRMLASRWITVVISGAVLAAGLALRPAAADDIGKETTCPVMGSKFKVTKASESRMVNGQPVYFCC